MEGTVGPGPERWAVFAPSRTEQGRACREPVGGPWGEWGLHCQGTQGRLVCLVWERRRGQGWGRGAPCRPWGP